MARRSAMQMDPRTMTGAPRGGGMARSLAPRPQMGPPMGGSRQPMTQLSQPGQQQQMMGEAIGDMAIDAATNGANDQQMPGFGPKPGRMDPRMQGQMQDMMGPMQRPSLYQPYAPMPQFNMPGPSANFNVGNRMPGTQMGNGFGQTQGNQMQPVPQPMPQNMQQPNSMSNFLNRNRFGR